MTCLATSSQHTLNFLASLVTCVESNPKQEMLSGTTYMLCITMPKLNITNKNCINSLLLFLSLELDDLISEKMELVTEGGARLWRCLVCQKISSLKTDISRHVEAVHIVHPGFQCYECYKVCKTRDALRCHINKYHKSGTSSSY